MSTTRAAPRAYLAGSTPAPPLQGVGAGDRHWGLLVCRAQGIGGGELTEVLLDQVGAGRKVGASVGTFTEVMRAGRKTVKCPIVASGRWRGQRNGRWVSFGQWPS